MLSGDRGEDKLYGGMGDDMLDGGDDDDTLTGGPGMDTLTGGEGDGDTASWAGSAMGVTVRLHTGQLMGGDAEGDMWGEMVTVPYTVKDEDGEDVEKEETVPDIENLTGSGHDDILAGDSRANTIMGGAGDDKLYGGPGGGADMLYGGGGDDHLFGGLGDDTLDGGKGDDTLHGGANNDTYYGGYGSDFIYADDAANDALINGWVKDQDPDTAGDQSSGAGTLGEATKDKDAEDTVSYERYDKGVTKTLLNNDQGETTAVTTGLVNIENLIGTDENDGLTGNNVANVIDGRDGADKLSGGTDTSTDLKDTVSYEMSDRGVTITVNSDGDGSASGGHAQGDTITNFENATGSAHSDSLTGDEGDNTLKGGGGDDDLAGSTGSDTLEGGAGADDLDGGTNGSEADGKEEVPPLTPCPTRVRMRASR